MSVGAQIWRQIVSRVEAVPGREISRPATARVVHSVSDPASSLMYQLFFPTSTLTRTSVLLAATDAQSKASGLCEQLAIALSNSSGEMVGIVESGNDVASATKKGPATSLGRSAWPAYTIPVADRVRRIPSALVCDDPGKNGDSPGGGLKQLRGVFSYFLLSGAITDSEMPRLCNLCDAAVLVVTANVTRKQAALKAKELLLRQGVTLLGVVLDQRTLPIPESIYQRL